jgi:broad specificity phosphatase PhoE
MAETTVVHLLRHGEVFNPEQVLYGRLPGYLLSETGEAMALAAAEWLSDKGITRVVSSPLERAQQTAAPIAGKLDLPMEIDDRLLEAGNAFEGLRVGVGDGTLRSPQHWWKLRNPFRPSWGEPYVEIAARMLAAVESARDAARVPRRCASATSCRSGRCGCTWRDAATPTTRAAGQCGLASVTSVTYDGDRVTGISYAEPAGATDPDAVPGA